MTFVQPENQVFLPKDTQLAFPHILVVEASAGSGKTFQLACRFVQYLVSRNIPNSQLHGIAALTFTNEAAIEMRRRTLQFLKETAFGKGVSFDAIKEIVELETNALKKAAMEKVDELIGRYDSLQVRTIDSFLYGIVLGAAAELGLSPMDEIMPFDTLAKEAALDALFVKAAADSGLLKKLTTSVLRAVKMHESTSWWPRLILSELTRTYDEKESIYGKSFERHVSWKEHEEIRHKLEKLADLFLKEAEQLGLELKKYSMEAIERLAGGEISKALKSKAFERDDPGELFKGMKGGGKVPPRIDEIWSEIRGLLPALCESAALQAGGNYLDILYSWRKELEKWKENSRAFFFSDINQYANRVIKDIATPEIILRLGEELHHFLIDEFQDTSLVQWETIRPLIENSLAQGGSLFCVGDRKQLLYRWRGSEETVFVDGPRCFPSVAGESLYEIQLPYNRRSRMEILSFVCRLFSAENLCAWLAEEKERASAFLDESSIVKAYSGACQQVPDDYDTKSGDGFVHLELMEEGIGDTKKMYEASKRWCVDLLKDDILKRYEPSDVMILCRRNADVETFSAALLEASVPVFSQHQMSIKADPIVGEIYSLLSFALNPEDKVALVRLLTGSIAQKVWGAIPGAAGWSLAERICSIISSRPEKQDNPRYVSRVVEDVCPDLWHRVLKPFVEQCGQLSPYEMASLFIRQYEVKQNFPHHWQMVSHFLALLHGDASWQPVDWPDLDFWHEAPDDIFQVKPGETNAVRVMTVHKAKGLEADVVILPFATLAPESRGTLIEVGESCLRIYKTKSSERKYSPKLHQLYMKEMERRWMDELNVLYVSVTRPRNELYMLVPPRAGRAKNSLANLVHPILNGETMRPFGTKTPKPKGQRPRPEYDYSSSSTQLIETSASLPEWKWPGYLVRRHELKSIHGRSLKALKAADIGVEIHALLARIAGFVPVTQEPGAVETYLTELLESRADRGHEYILKKDILAKLFAVAKTLCHPLARDLFWSDSEGQVWTEMEIADREGNLYRADRVVKKGGGILVGEFKTGVSLEEKDKEQIKLYLKLIRELYPHCEVKGLLLYLDKNVVLEIKG